MWDLSMQDSSGCLNHVQNKCNLLVANCWIPSCRVVVVFPGAACCARGTVRSRKTGVVWSHCSMTQAPTWNLAAPRIQRLRVEDASLCIACVSTSLATLLCGSGLTSVCPTTCRCCSLGASARSGLGCCFWSSGPGGNDDIVSTTSVPTIF